MRGFVSRRVLSDSENCLSVFGCFRGFPGSLVGFESILGNLNVFRNIFRMFETFQVLVGKPDWFFESWDWPNSSFGRISEFGNWRGQVVLAREFSHQNHLDAHTARLH